MCPRAVGWILVLALIAPRAAGATDAEARTASLSWVRRQGAEMCPGPADVARSVERRLGHAVFVPPARADLSVEAYVEHGDSGWHVDITLSGADRAVGHRELLDQEASCDHVAESAGLAIALMIDPDAVLRPESPAPAPLPVAAEPRPPEQRSTPAAAPAPPWQGSAEVAGGVAIGLLPEIAPAVFVRGRASWPSRLWAFELEGAYLFPQSVTIPRLEPTSAVAQFSLLYGGLSFCWQPELAPAVAVITCGGLAVGAIEASATGFQDPQPMKQSFLLDVVVKGRLSFRVAERWVLLVGGDFFVPLWRSPFQASPGGSLRDVFQPSVVAGAFDLGIALEF